MNRPSDEELRKKYADVIKGDGDPQTVRLLRTMAAGYRAVRPPVSLPPTRADLLPRVDRAHPRFSRRRHSSRGFSLSAAAVLLVAVAGIAYAVSSITNLGKPVEVLSPMQTLPLGGFKESISVLSRATKPRLLFIGAMRLSTDSLETRSAAERWPVVKALSQFGTFSGVTPARQVCDLNTVVGRTTCEVPTFDWSRAKYRSRYVDFVHKDLLDDRGRNFQTLTPDELSLYNRFSRASGNTIRHDRYGAKATGLWGRFAGKGFPLLVVGRYVQVGSDVVVEGDFEEVVVGTHPVPSTTPLPQSLSGLPFASVHSALVAGRSPQSAQALIPDVNAEANIITALICHTDGKKPASVCNRSVIKSILKHVK
jgi:hypothetical protein